MVLRNTFFAMAAAMLMLVALADPTFAQASSAGENILTTLRDTITGSIGLFIGLGITILGLWTWIIKQETGAGITMIVGGVLITLVPDIFNGVHDAMVGVMDSFSAGDNTIH